MHMSQGKSTRVIFCFAYKKKSIHHDSYKKIIVISEQQNTSAMHILYYLARSKDVKRPT